MASKKLQDELLRTLSFYEEMTLEFIYLDLDQEFLLANPELNLEDLSLNLKQLVRSKKVRQRRNEHDQIVFKRLFPQKSWHQKLWTKLTHRTKDKI